MTLSTDLCQKSTGKDTLIFKSVPPVQRTIFPISFNDSDKIRLIDSPHDGVKQAFDTAIRVSYFVRYIVSCMKDCRRKPADEIGCVAFRYPGRQRQGGRGVSDQVEGKSLVDVQRRADESLSPVGVLAIVSDGGAGV